MYLRVNVRCNCGCRYEFDRFEQFTSDPFCPSCRQRLDNSTLSGLFKIFEAANQIPEEMTDRLKFSLKRRDPN